MGRLHLSYIEADSAIYVCAQCKTHLLAAPNIMSRHFQGRHGKAYLVKDVVNVTRGPTEERMLITGLHSVCDIHCNNCEGLLGWKYEAAQEPSQKYKEGKYILEKSKMRVLGQDDAATDDIPQWLQSYLPSM